MAETTPETTAREALALVKHSSHAWLLAGALLLASAAREALWPGAQR